MDQNLVTVQWRLLSVFGVVVALLLIPHANRLYRAFLRVGTDPAYQQAFSWEWRIKGTALLVLAALFVLSIVVAFDAGLVVRVPRTSAITSGSRWLGVFVVDPAKARAGVATWLLLARLVAQGAVSLSRRLWTGPASPGDRDSSAGTSRRDATLAPGAVAPDHRSFCQRDDD